VAKTGEEGQGVQAKGDWQQKADTNAIFSNGSALPPAVMAKYENLMPGVSLEHVSLHQGSQVDAALGAAKLHGLTDGTNIAVSSKAPSGTLEHEIGHVGQRQEKGFSFNEVNRQAYEADADNISAKLLSDRPVERFEQTAGKEQLSGGVGKEGDEYENNANAVAAKVAAGESAEQAPRDLSETNSGEKQSQGRDPTDPHSTSSHPAQTIVNRFDEAKKKIGLGFSQEKEGNSEEALKLYEEAIKLAPSYSLAWYNRGVVLSRLNRWEEALDSYERALVINNNWGTGQPAYAWNNRGVVLYHLRRYNEALQSYQQARDRASGDKNLVQMVQNNLTQLEDLLFNNPSLRNQSQQAPEPEQGKNLLETLLGALLGAFNENQTGEEAVVDFLIGLIPIIGQLADARDFVAYLYRIVFKKQFNDLWNWIGLALTLVGLVPLVGDIGKFLGKSVSDGKLSELVKNADGVWSYIRSLAPGKFENIAQLKDLLAENWGKGVKDAQAIWNTALGQLLNWANGIPDLFLSQQKRRLIEAIEEVSRKSNTMLSQAFEEIWKNINEALDAIGRRINPNGELVTPEGVRLPSDEVPGAMQGPLRVDGGTSGSKFVPSQGFNELAGDAQRAITSWDLSDSDLENISSLLESARKAGDDEIRRLVQDTIQRRPGEAKSQVRQFVNRLWSRQQLMPTDEISIGSQPLASGGQNAVFEMVQNTNLLVKKPLAGSGDFRNEYRALLRMELMGIETALVKRAELDGQTVLILERISGQISKNIMDIREGPQYRHLITQKTIDDLEKIYNTLVERGVHINDFQFMVREGDGAVIMVDPKSLLPDTPPQLSIRNIINTFKGYFNQSQSGGR